MGKMGEKEMIGGKLRVKIEGQAGHMRLFYCD